MIYVQIIDARGKKSELLPVKDSVKLIDIQNFCNNTKLSVLVKGGIK